MAKPVPAPLLPLTVKNRPSPYLQNKWKKDYKAYTHDPLLNCTTVKSGPVFHGLGRIHIVPPSFNYQKVLIFLTKAFFLDL